MGTLPVLELPSLLARDWWSLFTSEGGRVTRLPESPERKADVYPSEGTARLMDNLSGEVHVGNHSAMVEVVCRSGRYLAVISPGMDGRLISAVCRRLIASGAIHIGGTLDHWRLLVSNAETSQAILDDFRAAGFTAKTIASDAPESSLEQSVVLEQGGNTIGLRIGHGVDQSTTRQATFVAICLPARSLPWASTGQESLAGTVLRVLAANQMKVVDVSADHASESVYKSVAATIRAIFRGWGGW